MKLFQFKKRPEPPKPKFIFLHVGAPAEGWADPEWTTDGALPRVGVMYAFRVVQTWVDHETGSVHATFALCPIQEASA